MKLEKNIVYVLTSEILFTILPLLILLIVRSYENKLELIFFNTEWSIMAIILFGQSIVKFSSGISNSNLKFRWQLVSLIISIIIIFGLIPSIVILIINLLAKENLYSMYFLQIIMFVLSICTFFLIGYLGQKMLEDK
ncbi:hypothetical protein [Flavobacterium turcicum]|uniref:Uncharacterized protein n=1 Tax=Flavobacterium turcicum TaxID=2764718 RepID=A0ABR7JJK5_9FLAO|nr:hypothetical protein [Flavobacterium turcicum]MBC5864637.1 hypothetical protein [Flavobacterium turcicum]NHL03364.1 hypothetical protein [Flavobacterium turcicum]